jgi:hypothetical protein
MSADLVEQLDGLYSAYCLHPDDESVHIRVHLEIHIPEKGVRNFLIILDWLREGVEHGEGLLVALGPRSGNEAFLAWLLTLHVLGWDPFLLIVIVEDVLDVVEFDHCELGED